MNVEKYCRSLKEMYNKIHESGLVPNEPILKFYLKTKDKDLEKLAILYTFYYHEQGQKTKVHRQLVKELINLKLK